MELIKLTFDQDDTVLNVLHCVRFHISYWLRSEGHCIFGDTSPSSRSRVCGITKTTLRTSIYPYHIDQYTKMSTSMSRMSSGPLYELASERVMHPRCYEQEQNTDIQHCHCTQNDSDIYVCLHILFFSNFLFSQLFIICMYIYTEMCLFFKCSNGT